MAEADSVAAGPLRLLAPILVTLSLAQIFHRIIKLPASLRSDIYSHLEKEVQHVV